MAIDENILFKTIYESRSDMPIEQIMQDVAKAKAAYVQAENDLTAAALQEEAMALGADGKGEPELKHLTRRNLKENPATAITDETITCCLCGGKYKSITSRHLKNHGTTPEIYRRLCGYDDKQILMSHNRARQMQETIKKAQANRKTFSNQNISQTSQAQSQPAAPVTPTLTPQQPTVPPMPPFAPAEEMPGVTYE